MASSDSDQNELREKLKASLWFAIGRLCTSECARLNISTTPQFVGALTEMVWAQIESVAIDLETFSRHAGRTTITTEDVLLVCRRNEALQEMIKNFVDKGKADAEGRKTRRPPKGKGKGKAKD